MDIERYKSIGRGAVDVALRAAGLISPEVPIVFEHDKNGVLQPVPKEKLDKVAPPKENTEAINSPSTEHVIDISVSEEVAVPGQGVDRDEAIEEYVAGHPDATVLTSIRPVEVIPLSVQLLTTGVESPTVIREYCVFQDGSMSDTAVAIEPDPLGIRMNQLATDVIPAPLPAVNAAGD